MQKPYILFSCVVLSLVVQITFVEGQILDQLFNQNNRNTVEDSQSNESPRFRDIFRDMMSSSMPGIYEVVRNGTSLGVNVLQGLVKVERGEEAERSGLQGPRPLSVRVFGIPFYERGVRVRNPGTFASRPSYEPAAQPSGSEPKAIPAGEEEELPIYP